MQSSYCDNNLDNSNNNDIDHSPPIEPKDSATVELDEVELNKKLSQVGYLTKFELESLESNKYKNLHGGFSWPKKDANYTISMLSVITGKNGIGKTALLEAILQGFERKMFNQSQLKVELYFDKQLTADGSIPDIFQFSSADPNGKILSILNGSFDDLIEYIVSERDKTEYTLKYPHIRMKYNKIREIFGLENLHKIKSISEWRDNSKEVLQALWEEEFGAPYGSLEHFTRYLLKRGVSLKDINKYLQEKKFKYVISDESYTLDCYLEPRRDKYPRMQIGTKKLILQEKGKIETINFDQLSPGEKLELLTLLWSFDTNKIIKNNNTGAVFVLDEFDAHLHPSLVKEVIEVIKTKLIGEYGVQVIMTTHNPTTVSLVPKENLYIMSNDNNDKEVEIKKADSKKQAIQLLTSKFVFVNEPFRIIFVEADDDRLFYEIVQEHLINKKIINPEFQLIFKAHGKTNEKGIENSGCSTVRELIKKCVLSQDPDKSLADFIFGLLDGDNQKHDLIPNLKALKRYSFENYLYDPIHIYFLSKSKKLGKEAYKEIYSEIEDELTKKGLKTPDSFNNVFDFPKEERNNILQTIATYISNIVMKLIKDGINNNDKVFSNIKEELTNAELVDSNGLKEGELYKESFLDGVQLEYPQVLFKLRGHSLEYVYGKIFPSLISINSMLSFCKKNMLIPIELKEVFEYFQQSSEHIRQAYKFGRETKSKNTSDASKLEAYKKELESKDKKIEGQKKTITDLNKNNQKISNLRTFFNKKITLKEGENKVEFSREELNFIRQEAPECKIQ